MAVFASYRRAYGLALNCLEICAIPLDRIKDFFTIFNMWRPFAACALGALRASRNAARVRHFLVCEVAVSRIIGSASHASPLVLRVADERLCAVGDGKMRDVNDETAIFAISRRNYFGEILRRGPCGPRFIHSAGTSLRRTSRNFPRGALCPNFSA